MIGADQTLDLEGRLHRQGRKPGRGPRPAAWPCAAAATACIRPWWWRADRPADLARNRHRHPDHAAFSDAFLEGYLERHGGAALGSVGCYQLEGEGAQLFTRIDGDYFAILGLPLLGLLDLLRRHGALPI